MTPAIRDEVVAMLARTAHDPLQFVRWAFRWRDARTSLADEDGPDVWQAEELAAIAESLTAHPHRPVLRATASGHGVGKSTQVAWLILWALCTGENTRGVVTANTAGQLRTKTWVELAKWHQLLLPPLRDLFSVQASSIHAADKRLERTWRVDAVPWSERNTEAFAGLHNAGKRVLILFDEASAIPDAVWEVAEGATTDKDTEIVWCAYGNPTRNTGRFREAVGGRFRHLWASRAIDAREVKRTNKARLAQWVEAYGEDSDFARVRVRGLFPKASSTQFIASDLVEAARTRGEPPYLLTEPLVFGVDVARFGDDASVLAIRRGRDARAIPWQGWRKMDTMAIAAFVFDAAERHRPDAVFVDVSGGLGAGVADRLRQMNLQGVIDVNFGGEGGRVALSNGVTLRAWNKSAAMWMKMRDWLGLGVIPDDARLLADLTGREYGFRGADNAIQLESKDDMKKRGLASPDYADALALTFAWPVAPRAAAMRRGEPTSGVITEYDIHAPLRD